MNVTVIDIEKSLIKVDSLSSKEALPLDGGTISAILTCKGDGLSVDIPADAQSWLSIVGMTTSGTSANVKFQATANPGGDRSATVVFKTTSKGKTYSSEAVITQKGAIVECSIGLVGYVSASD